MTERVSITQLRPKLRATILEVGERHEPVVVTRHGQPVAALVSIQQLWKIWHAEDEERVGPIDPRTGRPFGRAWVETIWRGRYVRAEDPEAHLHPSRDDAPWLGRPFPWPPEGAGDAAAEGGAQPPERAAEAPAPAPEPPSAWGRLAEWFGTGRGGRRP